MLIYYYNSCNKKVYNLKRRAPLKTLILSLDTFYSNYRIEDITDPEKLRLNPKVERNLCFYGYMRGVPLKNKSTMHIPGIKTNLLTAAAST